MMERTEIIIHCKTVGELASHVARDHAHLVELRKHFSDLQRKQDVMAGHIKSLEGFHAETRILLKELISGVNEMKATLIAPMGRGGFMLETAEELKTVGEEIKKTKEEITKIKTKVNYWAGALAVVVPVVYWVINNL